MVALLVAWEAAARIFVRHPLHTTGDPWSP